MQAIIKFLCAVFIKMTSFSEPDLLRDDLRAFLSQIGQAESDALPCQIRLNFSPPQEHMQGAKVSAVSELVELKTGGFEVFADGFK